MLYKIDRNPDWNVFLNIAAAAERRYASSN